MQIPVERGHPAELHELFPDGSLGPGGGYRLETDDAFKSRMLDRLAAAAEVTNGVQEFHSRDSPRRSNQMPFAQPCREALSVAMRIPLRPMKRSGHQNSS